MYAESEERTSHLVSNRSLAVTLVRDDDALLPPFLRRRLLSLVALRTGGVGGSFGVLVPLPLILGATRHLLFRVGTLQRGKESKHDCRIAGMDITDMLEDVMGLALHRARIGAVSASRSFVRV
jgi:hypothetical protein